MTRTIFIATALVVMLPAVPAHALVARTFVSAAGSDSNNCANVATPCRHLATAYAATAANGEIYILDPANYGSLTITGPVSIEGHGWASIAPVANNPAITINANLGDRINIIGVVLDGTDLANTTGIQFNSGGSLIVRDSVIRNFGSSGIAITPTVSSSIAISSTIVADNRGHGIFVQPSGANLHIATTLNRVEAYGNSLKGIGLFANVATGDSTNIQVTAIDTVASSNDIGFYALGGAGFSAIRLFRTVAFANVSNDIFSDTSGLIQMAQSMISPFTGGTGGIYTFQDNYSDGAFINGSMPLDKK